MPTVSFDEARELVIRTVRHFPLSLRTEMIPLVEADGRVLAADVTADRDYPPLDRSIRDGFAVRSADLARQPLRVVGEVRAGNEYSETVGEGEAVEIMTGAPMPRGTDQVVMVEQVTREGDHLRTGRSPAPGEFVNPRGVEAKRGEIVLARGTRLGFAQIAQLATVGCSTVAVFARPRVAILATGDEVVPVEAAPLGNQVRNSNSMALAVQVAHAGGQPTILPVALDTLEDTRRRIGDGLTYDLLLLSGGVSAGRYDLVETVLAEFGAEFFFDRVTIQPGQPLVFGCAQGRFFFGLPGNPASTIVTFALFGSLALRLLGGEVDPQLRIARATLSERFRHKPGLTRFLPAKLNEGSLTPIAWQGSSDVPSLARANCFMVARADRECWEAGDAMEVLLP